MINSEKFKKTKIFNPEQKNVRVYSITDESVYLLIENIPYGFFINDEFLNYLL